MSDLVKYVGDDDEFESPGQSIFIQWKGTNVCMDFWCECGFHGHLDGEFVYSVKCGNCGAVYAMPSTVALKRIEPGHEFYERAHVCYAQDDDDPV